MQTKYILVKLFICNLAPCAPLWVVTVGGCMYVRVDWWVVVKVALRTAYSNQNISNHQKNLRILDCSLIENIYSAQIRILLYYSFAGPVCYSIFSYFEYFVTPVYYIFVPIFVDSTKTQKKPRRQKSWKKFFAILLLGESLIFVLLVEAEKAKQTGK